MLAGALATASACGDVTANGAAPASGAAGRAAASAAGGRGATGSADGTTNTNAAVPTDTLEFPCTVCRRAENCCKAEGLTDCGYTAACADATNAAQTEFYLALCRAVLRASRDGSKSLPDACGF